MIIHGFCNSGPEKYDLECTMAREMAHAKGAILMIIEGNLGSGFSVQLPPAWARELPNLLRTMADVIEGELKAEKQ